MAMKFLWGGATNNGHVQTLGQSVTFDGFHFGGNPSIINPSTGQLQYPDATWYLVPGGGQSGGIAGFGLPSTGTHSLWYGAFAVKASGDTYASIKFVPFVKASSVSYSSGTGTVNFDTSAHGSATSGYFAGGQIQLVTQDGSYYNSVLPISANTSSSFSVTAATSGDIPLVAGDYVLPCPGPNYSYGFLKSFWVTYSGSQIYQFQNFFDNGFLTAQYVGQIGSDITGAGQANKVAVDFTDHISPLATGVHLMLNVYNLGATLSTGTTLYLDGDGSGHVIGQVGINRASPYGQGPNAMALIGLGNWPKTYAYLNDSAPANTVGKVVLMGFVE